MNWTDEGYHYDKVYVTGVPAPEYILAMKLWIAWLDFYIESKSAWASFFNFWNSQFNL